MDGNMTLSCHSCALTLDWGIPAVTWWEGEVGGEKGAEVQTSGNSPTTH